MDINLDGAGSTFHFPACAMPSTRNCCLSAGAVALLGILGCHFRVGLGPEPCGPPSVDHFIVRDMIEDRDGGRKVTETDTTTTKYEDGRSTTQETVNVTVTQPDGATSKSTTQTTTERSSNGSVSTSTTSSSGGG